MKKIYNRCGKRNALLIGLALCTYLAGTLGISRAEAAFTKDAWQFERPIVNSATTSPSDASFLKIVLPENLSRSTTNLNDIRIVDQNGIETPYILTRTLQTDTAHTEGRILNASVAQGMTQFVVDSNKSGNIHSGIIITTHSDTYQRQVRVYASDSLLPLGSTKWNLITDKGYIFKFTDPVTGFSSGRGEIMFPANTSRYLKVVIASGKEGPVQVESTQLFGDTRVNIPTYTKEVPVTVTNDAARRSTDVTVDMGSTGLLTHAVTLRSRDTNYSRRVIMESSEDGLTWSRTADGVISHVTTALFQGSSTRIDYPEQRARYIRLSIVNNDNQPLTIEPVATVEGNEIAVLFETKEGKQYTLFYGNPAAAAPVYDITQIAAYIEENNVPSATLGAEILNPAYVAPQGPVVPFTESHKMLLNIVLGIVLLVIIGGIAVYLRTFTRRNKGVASDFVVTPQGFDTELPKEPIHDESQP